MKQDQGNVLFLILIAVALFAALSYAVTSSTRSGGGSADKERRTTEIATILQHGVAVRTAVLRMIASGTPAENLLFDQPVTFSLLTAAQIPREVFHPQGGGAVFKDGWVYTSGFEVTGVGLSDIGNPVRSSEIIAITDVSREVCLEINKRMGINISEDFLDFVLDVDANSDDENMDRNRPGINGGYNGFLGQIGSGRDTTFAPFDSMQQGCFYTSIRAQYIYYDIIVAR